MPIFASNFASNSLSGAVRVTNGFANITLATIPYALEGDKSFVIKIRKDSISGEVLAVTPTLNFRENGSLVDFSANTSTVSEGGLVAFTVTTANVTNGANLFYSIFPVTANVTADDFTANAGSFTITNNAGTFALQAKADTSLVDETGETFKFQLRTSSPTGNIIYTSSNITILDTYKTYNILTFAPTVINSIESSNITFTFSATNVPLGTTFYYETAGNATVTSNTGSFAFTGLSNTITVFGDAVGTGEIKEFVLKLRTGSNAGPVVATSSSAYVLDSALAYMAATGGNYVYTIYDPLTATGYKVHKFLSSNNFTITRAGASPSYANIEILMVAGGGSGGATEYPGTPPGGIGAGGAGGLLYYGTKTVKTANGPLLTTNTSLTYAVVVGAGGTAGNAGSNTTFLINSNVVYRAVGGGGGTNSINGGSGGAAGTGISGQGNPGAPGVGVAGGGGGGAGGAGSPGYVRPWPSYPGFPQGVAGSGGNGLGYDIEGVQMGANYGIPSTVYYAGGGGGGTASGASAGSLPASGGIGGGGGSGTPGTPGTGGGGGGGYGATGGPGVVIISYPYVPLPEYTSLQSNAQSTNIIEGNQVYFTLNANFLANNSLLYYSTVGNVTSSNFIGGNTGSFRTRLNSTTFALTSNTNIPDNETRYFQIEIRDNPGTSSNALIVSSGNAGSVFSIIDTNLAPPQLEMLIVAGGGGAVGPGASGGAGAGGLLYYGANTLPKTPNGGLQQTVSGTYSITVGAGGAQNTRGSNSVISLSGVDLYTASGGGTSGAGGGSGGGSPPVAGTPGQGNPGGPSSPSHPTGAFGWGGGGGAGAAGAAGVVDQIVPAGPFARGVGGAGGAGLYYDISGTDTAYAGGGGGGGNGGGNGAFGGGGGSGVGGTGGDNFFYRGGTPGAINTGGGGGGGGSTPYSNGTGGPGVVILRYPSAKGAASATTGNPNVTVSGGYRIYRYWQSGTITF